MKEIGITQDRYIELLEKEAKLDALEAAGVDNWGGYSFAMTECYQPVPEEEYELD